MTTTPRRSIDRLTLSVPGLTAEEARRLAEMVGVRLSADARPFAPVRAGPLRVAVTAPAGRDLGRLADAIAAEILRNLQI